MLFNVKHYTKYFFALSIFIILFIFFSNVHPIVPYDGDDWQFLSYMRKAVPLWGNWNPIKLFPEIFMSTCAYIAVYCINPLINDYIYSLIITYAFVISFCITIYIYSFKIFIKEIFAISEKDSIIITLFFFLFHFLIFKSNAIDNAYMFWALDLTCYFHYLIPALLNSILVMYFIRNKMPKREEYFRWGMLLLLIYLAIFSNVYHSIILISVIISKMVVMYIKIIKRNDRLVNFFYLNKYNCLLILVWIVSLIFEANGGRSHQIGKPFMELPIKETLIALKSLLLQMNKEFLGLFIISNILAFVVYIKEKNKDEISCIYKTTLIKISISICVILPYLVLLAAKSVSNYITNTSAVFGLIFYLFLLETTSIAYILKKKPKIMCIVPIILLIIFVQTIYSGRSFRESNYVQAGYKNTILVDMDLINQVVAADKAGLMEMTLEVPKGDARSNWPHHALYMGWHFSNTLYRHGLISKPIKIHIKPNKEKNIKYNIPIPKQ